MPLRHSYEKDSYHSTAALVPTDVATGDATARVTKAIYLSGGAGDVNCMMADGLLRTFGSMQPGVIYPLAVVRIAATGTGAGVTPIIGLY